MMLLLNLLKTNVIRQVYVLNVNGCVGQSVAAVRKRVGGSGTCKMLQTFEDCVFQQKIDKRFISFLDYDKKIALDDTTTITKCYQKNTKTTMNSNEIKGSACKKHIEQQQPNHCKEYEEAVKALNTLQSNAESLRSSINSRQRLNSLENTQRYLEKSGLTVKDLEKLSYIHVAGTKGKGSTCALTDSILRAYGVKTGFYSSPHLVSLTERIRINGQPISKQKFTQYFWPVYNKLLASREYENDMPAYFKFLTILAFHVYLQEKVDVVILEVGIGGELDSTNIVPNTKTVGITSLGLEHTQLLGNTLDEIAWQKAGIIKPHSTVYTSCTQSECWEVIQKRAAEKNAAQVYKVPQFEEYFRESNLEGLKQHLNNVAILNGSLALQLAYDWLRQNRNGFHKDYEVNKPRLTEQAIKGIANCSWPGRCQRLQFFNFNIHLDGAHTVESMQVCGNWFQQITTTQQQVPKILIFNTTGDRDSKKLLNILRSYASFELVCFVPNISSTASSNSHDTTSVLYTQAEQLKRCQMHSSNWQQLCSESNESNTGQVFPSIMQSFQYIRQRYDKNQELNILVTGSIHLIGATILSLNELCRNLAQEA